MSQTIEVDGKEYQVDTLSNHTQSVIKSLQFTEKKLQELTNTHAVLQRAKKSYIDELKREMLSDKAGFLFGND